MNKSEKCSITQKNRIVIHKDSIEKRIYKDELEKFIKEGWSLGQSDNHRKLNSSTHKGHTPWNKDKTLSEEQKQKISDTLKGNAPWNKGLTKESDKRVAEGHQKSLEAKIKKYGCSFPNNPMDEKHRTNISIASQDRVYINRNGITKRVKNTDIKSYIDSGWKLGRDPEQLQIKLSKDYLTRKKNQTFNSSKDEDLLYENLLIENNTKTIFRNYKDKKRYPYYCDFYIVEDDLFIELNAHWTHGGHPFDPNNEEDIKQLEIWKEKAKTSAYYKNAIYTWTVRDVEKQKCAKDNNLKYKVIY